MKRQGLFLVALCMMLIALPGCRQKVSSVIVVQDTLKAAAVYADQGGTLKWESADSNTGKFKIVFSYGIAPCKDTDILNNQNSPDVICHVVQNSGTYIYQVVPLVGKAASTTTPPEQNLAQVGGCKGCKAITKGGQQRHEVTPTDNPLIGCPAGTQKAVVANSPASVSPQDVLEWTSLGPDPPTSPTNGATFDKSPCTSGSVGPFYGPDNVCTIDSKASGTYTYTAVRADCQQKSDPYTFTVQP